MQAKPEKRKEGTCHRSIKTLKPQYLTTTLSQISNISMHHRHHSGHVDLIHCIKLKEFALGISKQDKKQHHHHHQHLQDIIEDDDSRTIHNIM
jgi:hypothetical protein